jgi:hypothetical protein
LELEHHISPEEFYDSTHNISSQPSEDLLLQCAASDPTGASQSKPAVNNASEPITAKLIEDITKLLPVVAQELLSSDCLSVLQMVKDFLSLLAAKKYPTNNISLRLFMETVQWYTLENASQMRYSNETLKFWKMGYRLLQEKFILFMGGLKNTGQIVAGDSQRGFGDPAKSNINFVVPSISILRSFNQMQFPQTLTPGIIDSALIGKEEEDVIISFDAKKLVPGFNSMEGDIDLFGHEDHPTKTQERDKLNEELTQVDQILSSTDWSSSSGSNVTKCGQVVLRISTRVKHARSIKLKEEQRLERLLEKAREDNYVMQ